MMGYQAPSKKAIRDAIKALKEAGGPAVAGVPAILRFHQNVQETSLFGLEAKVPGQNTVVGPDAYSDRRWYATLTVDESGTVTAVR
jgi:hypothetical protein